ncbi:MAG: LecA/PA-IL family lectin [Planctomycetota bacterium]
MRLSRIIAVPLTLLCISRPSQAEELLTVPANPAWSVSTSTDVFSGYLLDVTASGTWRSGVWTGGPEGNGTPPGGGFDAPYLNAYSLIGKLGLDLSVNNIRLPIYGSYIAVADSTEKLWLGMNDVPGVYGDNTGFMVADVRTCVSWEQIAVPANFEWSASSYMVEVGRSFVVKAEGTWGSGSWSGGADGDGTPPGGGYIMPGESAYSLIARIGSTGQPFFVGSEYRGIASTSGELQLGMNDVPGLFGDNFGELAVTVGIHYPDPELGNGWQDLGNGLAGAHGIPELVGTGAFSAGSTIALTISHALESSSAVLVVGLSRLDVPFKGGVLVPSTDMVLMGLPTDANGRLSLSATAGPSLPSGIPVYLQYWVADAAAPVGYSASNALRITSS